MKDTITILIAVLALLFSTMAAAAIEQGKDYVLLNPAQPASSDQIEVLEFFSYGCVNCYRLNTAMSEWYSAAGADVSLIRVPVIFDYSMAAMARLYYALQSLGRADGLHGEIYKEVHVGNFHLAEALADKPSRLTFVQTLAVDPGKFADAYDSVDVERRLADTETIQQRYQIREIPTLVVDGKYTIAGLTPERTVQVLREVVQLARDERHIAAPGLAQQPGLQRSTVYTRPLADENRPTNRDKTHCLDLESYQEIAKCTGEQ